jgi:hypothetical protein
MFADASDQHSAISDQEINEKTMFWLSAERRWLTAPSGNPAFLDAHEVRFRKKG